MELVGNTFFFDWEVSLIIWLQAHMGAFGTWLASFLSAFGEELACVAVIGFLYWCYDKRFGRFVGLNVLVGLVLNPMIKTSSSAADPISTTRRLNASSRWTRARISTTSPRRSIPSPAATPPTRWRSTALWQAIRKTGPSR